MMEVERTKAYLQERLPAGWKVKNKGLEEVTTMGTVIGADIQDEITTGEVHDKSRVKRNADIDEFYHFQVDCRAKVKLDYGDDSPEYQAIPWTEPQSAPKPKPGQPEDNK
jgi:hypothetical protein